MMCQNCKKTLSCGCQSRKASDGRIVCSNCITKYELNLKVLKNIQKPPQQQTQP
jgi:hypothetical protein